jgi:hypothetical protein
MRVPLQLFKEIMLNPDSAPMALEAEQQGGGEGGEGGGNTPSTSMGASVRSALAGADDEALLARSVGERWRGGGSRIAGMGANKAACWLPVALPARPFP